MLWLIILLSFTKVMECQGRKTQKPKTSPPCSIPWNPVCAEQMWDFSVGSGSITQRSIPTAEAMSRLAAHLIRLTPPQEKSHLLAITGNPLRKSTKLITIKQMFNSVKPCVKSPYFPPSFRIPACGAGVLRSKGFTTVHMLLQHTEIITWNITINKQRSLPF